MPRNKKIDLKEHWSKDIFLYLPRDRYLIIQHYIHFSDNEVASENNGLNKVENMVTQEFQTESHPQNLLIDKSMVLFKGRLSFKQVHKDKKTSLWDQTISSL